MTNWRDGSVNFEQRGVEFPDFWSVNAANIVTTKYFRGAVGTDAREWSLRQLIDRVVHKYRAAGEEHGYFASPADAEIFEHELTWMLLHQVFSFNSPVWFNVGTSSPQQVSRVLHPRGRRHDGLDPELVPRGRADLQGWLGRRAQPVPNPFVEGAAVLRRHRLRSGELHARRRRVGGHDQVRRRHPARGQDGRPRRRPPGHRRVRRRPRRARRTRSASCATPASTWTSAARTSRRCSTRTPTTRCGSRDEFMRAVEEGRQFGLRARTDNRVIESVDAKGAVRPDRPGGLGVRRPGHPVRRHDQRLAHQPGDRPDHGLEPVLGVHEPGQHVVQPGVAEPDEVPRRRQRLRRREVRQGRRADHHRDGHLDLLRRLPDRGDRRQHPRLPAARHRLRQPRRAADGLRAGLRLRRRPGAGRRDHVADDRRRLPPFGRAGRHRRSVRGVRPQRQGARPGDAQARRGQRRRALRCTNNDRAVLAVAADEWARGNKLGELQRLAQCPGHRCSRPPAPSA